ncbi:PREDICTED: uncharacterized protein LOC109581852 [Amphimedon queenslandica]|uniref:Uncharacterized protein n=1 Tax=Amphimedon queenslandica TaxID=400682 RepID=A0A1X7UXP8_AMPQE|nr:PREDICTED: uncharacterized protein LOC109581852 [Amphimedon queenslandica]|eukprot:XP_019851881.1 PREDICTED: uncharacterized protein LOC109581852 [Amphimedon queenslandica]
MECHGRCRLLALLLSLLGLFLVSLMYFFSSTPSILVTMSPPKRSQKVSVFLCLNNPTLREIEDIEKDLHEAFSDMKLDHETFIVVSETSGSSLQSDQLSSLPTPPPHHHREVLSSPTCTGALSKAHFSILLVIGANMSYYKDTVHGLIEPLINSQAELTLTYNVDESFSLIDSLLLLCIYPLTGAAYIPPSPVLAILTPTLTQGCEGVEGQEERGGSLSVELVSRCALHNWLSVSTSLSDIHGDSTGRITLSQVTSLWWSLHPFLCVFGSLILFLLIILTVYVFLKRSSSSKNIRDMKLFIT